MPSKRTQARQDQVLNRGDLFALRASRSIRKALLELKGRGICITFAKDGVIYEQSPDGTVRELGPVKVEAHKARHIAKRPRTPKSNVARPKKGTATKDRN